jgi:hypothetical protein
VLELSQCALNQVSHFIGSTVNGLVKSGGLIGDRNGLKSFKVGFNHAAEAVITVFMFTVLIAQVYINRCDAIADSAQRILHDTPDLIDQGLMAFNVVVSSDLNLHGDLLG